MAHLYLAVWRIFFPPKQRKCWELLASLCPIVLWDLQAMPGGWACTEVPVVFWKREGRPG